MVNRPTRLALFSLSVGLAAAQGDHGFPLVIPADPFVDPKNDPLNPLRYIASNTLTTTAFVLLILTALAQTWCLRRWRGYWMSAMTIGIYTFSAGIAIRYGLHTNPRSKNIYIAEYILVVLSPCAFIAADYILLARLARHLKQERHLLVPVKWITAAYIASDITTFLIQAIGGSISVSSNKWEGAQKGAQIFFAGLICQLISFSSFSLVYCLFLYRVWRHDRETWSRDSSFPWYNRWHALAIALAISCIGLLVRSTFRVIELSEGFGGALTRSEPLFYGLDTLPLWVAIVVYVPFWPGRFIKHDEPAADMETEAKENAPVFT